MTERYSVNCTAIFNFSFYIQMKISHKIKVESNVFLLTGSHQLSIFALVSDNYCGAFNNLFLKHVI